MGGNEVGAEDDKLKGDVRPRMIKSPCNRVSLGKKKLVSLDAQVFNGIQPNSAGSVTNSSSSVSGSFKGATSISGLMNVAANFLASFSSNPQQTKLPFAKTKTSPSLPLSPHFGIHHDSWSVWDIGGRYLCNRERV